MKKVILNIGGMSCSACSNGLEKYLNKQDGIIAASVNLVLAQALIEYEDFLKITDIEKFISEAGYESLGIFNNDNKETKSKHLFSLIIFGILALLILYISMGHMLNLPSISFLDMNKYPFNYALSLLILVGPFLVYGRDIFKSGIKNAYNKTPNMDSLVSLGVVTSFLYSLYSFYMVLQGNNMYVERLYFESSAIIIYFIKLGRFIDLKSKEKTKEAIKELVQITPTVALIKKDGQEQEVTIDEVKKGDILICKPGMKIAVDGEIITGDAYFDEAFITGEATLCKKVVKDKVIAGSVNLDGYIEYKAEKIGKESTISEIVRLVVEASNTKAPIQRLADYISGYFVPGIIIIAVVTLVFYLLLGRGSNEAITSFVTVLVVACPCALGLATPLAVVISEGLCAKNGILVKNSETLEMAHKIDTVVFDKTGTLTNGNLQIAFITNFSKMSEQKLMEVVVSLESYSTHPIAKAFNLYKENNNLEIKKVSNFKNIAGMGLEGNIDGSLVYVGSERLLDKLKIPKKEMQHKEIENCSLVYLIIDNELMGLIGVKDIIRENAKEAIDKLKRKGINIVMLTGDKKIVALNIANKVGIKEVISDVLPKEKGKYIKKLIESGKKVMMIGDGINDAPSLASSSIGVSVNSGTDIAADSADVILMNNDLEKITTLINISKKTIKIIKQNLFWAFFYNICMIPIAMGLFKSFAIEMNPMLAGLAMTISSLTVVFNSLRLKRWKDK